MFRQMKKLLCKVSIFIVNSVYERDPSQVFHLFQDSSILMNFLHIKILEKSKRSSYQSVINSVSCIKPSVTRGQSSYKMLTVYRFL